VSAKLRVAIAGAGFASGLHLQGWRRLVDVDVVAICDPHEAKAKQRAREFGIQRAYDDVVRMLDSTTPDALDIVSPMETHVELCRLAAERGIDVMCQKPLAPNLADARSLASDVTGRIRLMVHENWRFRPHYRQIKRWIDEGAIGKAASCVMQVRSSGLLPGESGVRPQLVRQPFCASLERFMINETLIHHLDVLRWLLGPLTVAAARIGFGCPAIRGEDRAVILLDGHECWAALDGNASVRGFSPAIDDALEITGPNGTIGFTGGTATLVASQSASASFDLVAGYADSYAAAIAHFAKALTADSPFETDLADNLATLALVEQAYASARTFVENRT
jgi:predicted dehydrogenase